jgi:CRP/FNR family cyclic AMP-dependent transcriptional regulator
MDEAVANQRAAEIEVPRRWVGRATALFRKMPIFADLSEDELQRLVALAVPRIYKKGTIVFQEGDTLDSFYVIVQGKLKALRRSPAGKNLAVGVFSSGHTIGDWLLFDRTELSISLEALEEVVIVSILSENLEHIVGNNPSVLRAMARVSVRRVKYLQDRVLDMISCKAEERVVKTLKLLTKQFGAVIPLTHIDIGEMAGTSRETATRVIAQLRTKGVVSCVRGSLIVLDDF